MRRTWRKRFAAVAALLLFAACRSVIPGELTGNKQPYDFANPPACRPDAEAGPDQVKVRYLGAGNVYVEWRGEAVLIGPFFSNVGYVRAYFLKPRPDQARIDAALATIDRDAVRAILAGHSHYDHIADLPYVAPKLPNAKIYVNQSAVHMLAGEKLAGTPLKAGESYDVSNSIRIRAVASSHAPQICGWNRFPCTYAMAPVEQDWTTPWSKRRLKAFGRGDTLAFVIELRDAGKPPYRIYFNDSAAASPLGQTEGQVDLAILAAAQWSRARDYPRDLLALLQPRHVVVSHWESFFTKSERPGFVPFLDAPGFIAVANTYATGGGAPVNAADVCGATDTLWTMPRPGASLLFDPPR